MKKLFVDLEICYNCKNCKTECSYYYQRPKNNGIERSLAKACQYLVCRRCGGAFCVKSCPNNALEKDAKGILQKHSMLCTSCKSCAMACPFGVIYKDILPYKTSGCDWCAGRANGSPPKCVETCPEKALQYVEVSEDPLQNIYVINEYLAVKAVVWRKKNL